MKNKKNERLVIAHRGAMAAAPENTEAAFDLALEYPIDGFETDIQMTSDGVLVIYHDRTTKKLEKKPRQISKITLEELLNLDCGDWFSEEYSGQKIMSLDYFLEKYLPQTMLMLELKSYPGDLEGIRRGKFLELLADSLKKFTPQDIEEKVSILSFDADLLSDFYKMMPRVRYVMNMETDYEYFINPEKTPHFVSALCMDINDMDSRFVNAAKAAGRKTYTYSCNNPNTIAKAVELGLDGIMTDDPTKFFSFYLGN